MEILRFQNEWKIYQKIKNQRKKREKKQIANFQIKGIYSRLHVGMSIYSDFHFILLA